MVSLELVCPNCRVYCREGRSDGWNVYTVCSYCGRSELVLIKEDEKQRLESR